MKDDHGTMDRSANAFDSYSVLQLLFDTHIYVDRQISQMY